MSFYPTRPQLQLFCFIIISIVLVLSCSKDSDLLRDSVLNDATQSIEDRNTKVAPEGDNPNEPEDPVDIEIEVDLESRTTTFFPIQDAYLYNGEGINHDVIRLQTDKRTSYLLFDLSAIDSIGGEIIKSEFQFTIFKDGGDGEIKIHKGAVAKWNEVDIDESSAPESKSELGSIDKTYEVGQTETVELNSSEIFAENTTIILEQATGDDVAIASKENPTEEAPKLIITYETAVEAGAIEDFMDIESIGPEEDPEEDVTSELKVAATADKTKGDTPLEVVFKGEATNDDQVAISTYNWDFKDGSTADTQNPTHTFEEKGIYKVEFTATDENDRTNTTTLTIVVGEHENEAPVAKATADTTKGSIPFEVVFKGEKSTDDIEIKNYSWDFKDETPKVTTANAKHTFTEVGTYEVVLTVTDDEGLTNTTTITIIAEELENKAPIAKVSADKTNGEAPLKVRFNGKESSDDVAIKTYLWDFNDGKSNSVSPTHTFDEPGTYVVKFTVTDAAGLKDTETITIEVEEPANEKPVSSATASVTKGEAPLKVVFSSSKSTDDKKITKYIWDFDGNGISNDDNPIQTFNNPGTYKVKLTVVDEEGLTDSDTITITVQEEEVVIPSTSADVKYWKDKFDTQWSIDRSDAYSRSNSKGKNQEYYFLGHYIDGLSTMWQATGDNKYLDTAIDLIDNTLDDVKSVGGGYYGWPAHDGNEYALWDTYYWRHVATLIRIIHQTPSIKNSSKYKSKYNELLAFTEKNIWDRYYKDNLTKIYRTRTHMSSHWARIAMELYIITGESQYKNVFNNMSYGTMVNLPSNFRDQIYANPKDKAAYAWDQTWGVSKGSNIQDTSHGGAIISFFVLAYENNMYWKKSDMNALLRTINVIWTGPQNITTNIDGTGGYAAKGRLHEWFYLARYSQSLQNRIKKDYQSKEHMNFFGSQALGVAALNAKILADGSAVYP